MTDRIGLCLPPAEGFHYPGKFEAHSMPPQWDEGDRGGGLGQGWTVRVFNPQRENWQTQVLFEPIYDDGGAQHFERLQAEYHD